MNAVARGYARVTGRAWGVSAAMLQRGQEARGVAAGAGHRYQASLDRAGQAVGAGGVVGGLVAVLLVTIGSGLDPLPMLLGFAIGAVVTAVAAMAVGGPAWLVCHMLGWRGPWSAAIVGALAGLALFLGGQTYGFGAFAMPVSDAQTLLYRWVSALATSLVLAMVAAGIGWTMWRVAYRRIW